MNDIPRNKFEILDLIFTFLIALCMVLTSIYLLYNLVVSLIYIIIVVIFACVIIYFWILRNPFIVYLIRTLAFSNLITTFITLMIFFSNFTPTSTDYPGYIILLVPSSIYLLISFKFSSVTTPLDKIGGTMLVYAGRIKAAMTLFIRDNPEEGIKREEFIAKHKKAFKYKLIVSLCIVLILSSIVTLILGFN